MQETKIIKNDSGVEFTPFYAIGNVSGWDPKVLKNNAYTLGLKIERLYGKAKDGRLREQDCLKTEQVKKLLTHFESKQHGPSHNFKEKTKPLGTPKTAAPTPTPYYNPPVWPPIDPKQYYLSRLKGLLPILKESKMHDILVIRYTESDGLQIGKLDFEKLS